MKNQENINITGSVKGIVNFGSNSVNINIKEKSNIDNNIEKLYVDTEDNYSSLKNKDSNNSIVKIVIEIVIGIIISVVSGYIIGNL